MPRPSDVLRSVATRVCAGMLLAVPLAAPRPALHAQAPHALTSRSAARLPSPALGAAWHPLFTRAPRETTLDLPVHPSAGTALTPAPAPGSNNPRLAELLAGFWTPNCFANSYDPGERDIGAPEPGTRILIPILGADIKFGRVWYGYERWSAWRPSQLTRMAINNFPDVEEVLESTPQGMNPSMIQCDSSGCGVRFLFYQNKSFDRGFDLGGAYKIWYHQDALRPQPSRNWMRLPAVQFVPADGNAVSGDEGFYLRRNRKDLILFTHNELVAWVTKRAAYDTVQKDSVFRLQMVGEWRKLTYKSHTYRYADTTRGEITLTGPSFYKSRRKGMLLSQLPVPYAGGPPPSFIPYFPTVSQYPAIEGGMAEGVDHPLLVKARNIQGGNMLKGACENPTAAGVTLSCDNPPVPLADTMATSTQAPDTSLLKLQPADTAWKPLVTTTPPPNVWQYRNTVQGALAPDSGAQGGLTLMSMQESAFATYCAGLGYRPAACVQALEQNPALGTAYQAEWRATLDATVAQCDAGTLTNATLCDQAKTEQKVRDCQTNPRRRPDCESTLNRVVPDSISTLRVINNAGMDLALTDTVNLRAPNPPKYAKYTPGVCFRGIFRPQSAVEAEWQKKLAEHDMRLQQPDMVPMRTLPKPGDAANSLTAALNPSQLSAEQRAIYEEWWLRNCPGKALPTTWNLKGMQCDMTVLVPPPNVYRSGAGPRPAPPPPTGIPTRPPALDDD